MSNQSPRVFAATDTLAATFSDFIVLVARVLMGWLFLTNGWEKLLHMSMTAGYLGSLGVPAPQLAAWPAMATELGIGTAFILGIATRYAALVSLPFLVVATWLAHRFWELPPAQASDQYIHFCKNLAIFGGSLLLFIAGAGKFSLDAALKKR